MSCGRDFMVFFFFSFIFIFCLSILTFDEATQQWKIRLKLNLIFIDVVVENWISATVGFSSQRPILM